MYPSTLGTLRAVDQRINLYIRTFLGYTAEAADEFRLSLWEKHGTTLKGLEEHHGVDREHYCDFIHDIEERHFPTPNPELTAWLNRIPHPTYIFTNARKDWPVRGLKAMGLASILPKVVAHAPDKRAIGLEPVGSKGLRLQGIFDISFMDWKGKPHPDAYEKVEAYLLQAHGADIEINFADDRIDNLEAAQKRNWVTIWIAPPNALKQPLVAFDRVASSLTNLDPERLA